MKALLLLLIPALCFGAEFTVGSGGDFTTIALALADAGVGREDTLTLLDGTHVADDAHPYQDMTIQSQSGDKFTCLITNAGPDHHAFSLQDTSGVSFYNLEFRCLNGPFDVYDGCMIYADGVNASFYVEGCEFNYIRSDYLGSCGPASKVSTAARVEFVDCVFDSCRGPIESTTTCGAVFIAETKVTRVRRCVFSNNSAGGIPDSAGGALGIGNFTTPADSAIIVTKCLFIGNHATTVDAALRIMQINTDAEVSYCTFVDNTTGGAETGNISSSIQVNSTFTVDHCIVTGGNAYAVNNNGFITSAEHMNTWNTAEDHIFAGSHDDTIHINPSFNCFSPPDTCYAARAKECRDLADGSYMGWLEYTPPVLTAPTINPALHQSDYFQDLYAISDTVCCHSSHWDIITPDLIYSGKWMIYPYGSKSKLGDGINVKASKVDGGWSETFFLPIDYEYWKNEASFEQLFGGAIDSLAVQAVFSTCAADSFLSYQFIMQGW